MSTKKAEKPKILDKASDAEKVDPQLEPAGYKRDEQLAKRKDELEEAMETSTPEAYAMGDIPEDREIMHDVVSGYTRVTNKQPGYEYAWTYDPVSDPSNIARMGIAERFMRGYEFVQGDMPEAQELKNSTPDGRRRVGDVTLMRCKREVFEKWRKHDEAELKRKEGIFEEDIQTQPGKGVNIYSGPGIGQALAGKQFEQMLRTGTVPGKMMRRR